MATKAEYAKRLEIERSELLGLIDEYGQLRSDQLFDRAESLLAVIRAQLDAVVEAGAAALVSHGPGEDEKENSALLLPGDPSAAATTEALPNSDK